MPSLPSATANRWLKQRRSYHIMVLNRDFFRVFLQFQTIYLAYLEKTGVHKDSMCVDVANKTRTEIDFLGMKVVEYGKEMGVPTPFYTVMTNLVRTIENGYLND